MSDSDDSDPSDADTSETTTDEQPAEPADGQDDEQEATPVDRQDDEQSVDPADEQGDQQSEALADEQPAFQDDDREAFSLDDESTPMEGIAADVRERRQREQDTESDPFEEMAVDEEIDGELLWEDLLSEEEMSEAERAVGAGASATEVGPDTREEHVVEKDQFCGRCPYLSEPPMLACEHDGTEISEVADSDHFRVRNCPFAARDDDRLAEFD